MSTPPRKRAPIWVFSFAFFPLGLGGFILGAGEIVQGYRSLQWPPVEGVVLSSRLSKSILASPQPDIRYQYRVEGKEFVSARIWPGRIFPFFLPVGGKAAREICARFSERKQIPVYVNPSDPTEVALVPGPKRAYGWMSAFTFFLLLTVFSPLSIGRLREKL